MIENTPSAWNLRALTADTPWEAALWSERSQNQRFLTTLKYLRLRPFEVVLDYGCGTGRFSSFISTSCPYIGVDWSSEMLARARLESRGSYYQELQQWRVDHIVVLGTFNLAHNWSKLRTWTTLMRLWEAYEAKTLVVSLLRTPADGCLTYTPKEALHFAEKRTENYIIDASYLSNDLMLVMRRGDF